jgi:hypothetical protein
MRRAPQVIACSACSRTFVASDGGSTLAAVTGGCPVCGIGRWRLLGPEWPRAVGRLRSLMHVSGAGATPRPRA